MFQRSVASRRTHGQCTEGAGTARWGSLYAVRALGMATLALLAFATACAPASQPTLTPTPTPEVTRAPEPSPAPSHTPATVSTPTPSKPQIGAAEGLVMTENGQLIIGVNWTSKSRIVYVVQGGDVEAVRRFLGETARVTGEIVDRGPWLKEIVVRGAEASTATDRLSLRSGFIKELGISIYQQGTHMLTDREGNMICLLSARESGLDLNSYMLKGEVRVIGVMTKTVEGNAQIMEVKLVEEAK